MPANHRFDEKDYASLLRSLQMADGFSLLFVECSPAQAKRVVKKIKKQLKDKKIKLLYLPTAIHDLYTQVAALPKLQELDILFIEGLEKSFEEYIKEGYGGEGDYYVDDVVPRVLGNLNLQRERWRDEFTHLQIVFILPKYAMRFFMLRGNDFFDWRSGLFQFAMDRDLLVVAQSQIHTDSFEKYEKLTPKQRTAKLLKIQILLEEKQQTNQAELFVEQGLLYYTDAKYEQTLASFDKAVEIKSDYHQVWHGRGNVLDDLGRYEQALASYDKALKIKPDDHEAWTNRGNVLNDLGRYEQALASYDKALKIKPDD
ncbi:MAG: tetratricopeptide repeat protein, partial [Candidatus Marithrix sp.]